MRVIKRNIGIEELKSRIPGLFPYLEFDEFGNIVKHKATDSIDGCYGKIIPDLKSGVSYRTLITKYYNGENVDNIGGYTFEEVIGKFKVDMTQYDESQTLVPEYIYAAEAGSLLDMMVKLKKSCEAAALSPIYCCECQEYQKRGGDKMVGLLKSLSDKAKRIANDIKDLFDNDTNMWVSVDLCGTIEDLGYYTSVNKDNVKFVGDLSPYNPYCNTEILYSAYSKDGIDAPLELPNSENIPEIWNDTYDENTVWVARRTENSYSYSVTKVDRETELYGTTDSKLKSLRRYTTYINDNGVSELPEKDKDWLYFYRKGYVANYETVNDDLGNICFLDGGAGPIEENGYTVNLEAYGNVLYDITRDVDEKTITFVYYINAHLKAKQAGEPEIDDDGNTIYYYVYPFEYESGGVKQTETYYYAERGDIDELSLEEFNKLISLYTKDQSGKVEIDFAQTTNCRYEFSTMHNTDRYEKTIFGNNVNIEYGVSEFDYVKNEQADIDSDGCFILFKEDYITGIHYAPSVSSSVNIQRGNNAAFERHIRLGEVKTLEDMENYQNGAFFNIQGVI